MSIGQLTDRKERPPYVSFHRVAVEDRAASLAAGHYVAKDVDYAHVTPPYSKDMNKFPVTKWFEQLDKAAGNNRIPPEWLEHFQKNYDAWKKGEEPPLNGTPIRGWGVISPAMQETLCRLNILTVEDLAAVNDEGMRRIGMASAELRNKARAWLAQMNDKGPLTMKMAAVEAENNTLKRQLATLESQVKALMAASNQVIPPQPVVETIVANDLIPPSRAELVAAYTAKFNKPPHHRKSDATIAAELE